MIGIAPTRLFRYSDFFVSPGIETQSLDGGGQACRQAGVGGDQDLDVREDL